MSKETGSEARVTLALPDGSYRSVPVGWTDIAPPDPYMSLGGGRSHFRFEDLLALAELITGIRNE